MNTSNVKKVDTRRSTNRTLLSQKKGKLIFNCEYFEAAGAKPPNYANAYTECPRRNVPDFGRVFLMLKYTDITQNTYIQS